MEGAKMSELVHDVLQPHENGAVGRLYVVDGRVQRGDLRRQRIHFRADVLVYLFSRRAIAERDHGRNAEGDHGEHERGKDPRNPLPDTYSVAATLRSH